VGEKILLVNDILKCGTDECCERILWIDKKYQYCYTIKLFTSKIEIRNRNINDIEIEIESAITTISEEDPLFRIIEAGELSEKNKQLMNNAYEIVRYIAPIENEPQCFYGKNRSNLILQAIDKFNISDKTIYKYLRKYWQGGKIKNALLPDYYKCGNKENKVIGKKLGRPKYLSYIQGEDIGINVDEGIKAIFRIAISRYFLNTKGRSLAKTYRLMLNDFFTENVEEDGLIVKKIKSVNEIPSERQFKYWFYKTRDLENELKKRFGDKKFNLNYRQINSDAIYETLGPGFRYQIDATIGDVYLVNRIQRKSVIGRPVIYLAVDVFSHLITGVHVCLEGPSWNGASSLIYNCCEDKGDFCRRFGIDIDNADWPVFGLPRVIIADNGEMVGPLAEVAVANLGIALENTASYRGDAKGIVEQYFHVVNTKIKHWLPGEVKKEYRQRGERDYRLDAKLDIVQFTQIILQAVLNKNKSLMEKYPLSQEMINDGVNPIPIEIWNWGLKNKSGNLRRLPNELVRLNLMRRSKATVTEIGIVFERMTYTCQMAEVERWFSKARTKKIWYVDIAYDNRDMSAIYLIDDNTNNFITCWLRGEISSSALYYGKTFEEVADYNFMSRIRNTILEDSSNQNQFNMDKNIQQIISEAETMSGVEKRNVINIKENRKVENSDYRKTQALSNKQNTDIEEVIQGVEDKNKDEKLADPRLTTLNMIKQWKEENDI
jgi:hypothetical protein